MRWNDGMIVGCMILGCCTLWPLFRAWLARGTFLCFAKEKYPKERRPEAAARCAGSLRFSGQSARAQLAIAHSAIAQTIGALPPIAPAMLGGAYGSSRSTTACAWVGAAFGREPDNFEPFAAEGRSYNNRVHGFDFPIPVGAAEHRSPFAGKRAFCLSCSSGAGIAGAERTASQASAQKGEERREPRAAGQAVGVPFLLVTFLWASKEK